MHTIKDSIHQDIEVNDFELELIDTVPFQRLRRIRQMGFAYLVYPSAMHCRFEHSLGTMYVAGALSNHLGFDERTVSVLRVAGLLHDTGHFPFSHNPLVEDYVREMAGVDHVDMSVKIVETFYKDAIVGAGLSVKSVTDAIRGRGRYGSIFSSGIDVDKMDYLVRDAYFTGTAYGLIDVSRLIWTTDFKGGLAFRMKGMRNVEAVIISRFMMYSTVYFHRTIQIAGAMFGRAVVRAFEEGAFDVNEYVRMDDVDLVSVLRRRGSCLSGCLDERRLYKLGCFLSVDELGEREIARCGAMGHEEIGSVERDIEKKLGIPDDCLIINIIPKKTLERIKIVDGGKVVDLEEISGFSRSVVNEEWKNFGVQFLVPEKYRKKIEGAGKLFLRYV